VLVIFWQWGDLLIILVIQYQAAVALVQLGHGQAHHLGTIEVQAEA
jgi:hypothetical protein